MGITAVVMVGSAPAAQTPAGWVQGARRAAAADLVDQLLDVSLIDAILIATPDAGMMPVSPRVVHIPTPPGPIHVGAELARLTAQVEIERLLYIGGGAAPLMTAADWRAVAAQLQGSSNQLVTNNRHASDWAGVVPARVIGEYERRIPTDNMLAWVLSEQAGLPCASQPPAAASRLDIDTPTELLTLRLHAGVQPRLRAFLEGLPLPTGRLVALLDVLRTQGAHVTITGRVGPAAWTALNRATQCWLRVLSEERGMVSSGRQERGEVFSFAGYLLDLLGPAAFVDRLAAHADAVLLDTRVLFAHRKQWPDDDDRFAADLGLVEQVKDPWLRELTQAVLDAPIPILTGGHSLVAGNIFAFCDMLW